MRAKLWAAKGRRSYLEKGLEWKKRATVPLGRVLTLVAVLIDVGDDGWIRFEHLLVEVGCEWNDRHLMEHAANVVEDLLLAEAHLLVLLHEGDSLQRRVNRRK